MDNKILSTIEEHLQNIHEESFEVNISTSSSEKILGKMLTLNKLMQDDIAESTIQMLDMKTLQKESNVKKKVKKKVKAPEEVEKEKARLVQTIKDLSSKFDKTFSAKALQKNLVDKLKKSGSGMMSMLKPGNMIKALGLSMSSPLVMMLGEKLSDLQDTVKDSWKDNKQKDIKPKENFNKEQIDEKSLKLQERSTEALEEIASKKDPKEQKEGGFFGWLANMLGLGSLTLLMKKSKMFGKKIGMFSKVFGVLGKILGKVIFPLLAAYEIIKAFMNEKTLKDKIIGAAAGVFSLIAEIPEWIINGLLGLFGSDFKVDFSKEKIQEFFNSVFNRFKDPIFNFFDSIPERVRAALEFAKDIPDMIVTKFNRFLDFFRVDIPAFIDGIVQNVFEWFDELKSSSPLEMIGMLSDLMTMIPRKILNVLWDTFSSIFPDVAATLEETVSNVKNGLINFAKNMMFSILPDKLLDFMGISKPQNDLMVQEKEKINRNELVPSKADFSQKYPIDTRSGNSIMSNTNNYIAPPDMNVSNDDQSLHAAMGVRA